MIIYKIQNNINNKIYIGQTVRSLNNRVCKHLRQNKYPIQRVLNKHGINSFTISIIDYANDQVSLNEKEIYWIKFYDCIYPKGYNITSGGYGSSGYKHTNETKLKIKECSTGKVYSEESKNKIRVKATGRTRSSESKEKQGNSLRGKLCRKNFSNER